MFLMIRIRHLKLPSTVGGETMGVRVKNAKTVVLLVTVESTALAFYRGYLRYLVDRGWNVVVGANSSSDRLRVMAQEEGARFIHVNWKREPALFSDIYWLFKVAWILRKLRPNTVVSATPKAGLIGTLAATLARVPVRIYQLWGLRLETTKGLFRALLIMLEWLTSRVATQVVANSRSLARRFEVLGLAREGSVVVLGNGSSHGVDIDRFDPDVEVELDPQTQKFLDENPANLTVVFVGRLHKDKGVDTLLSAVALAAKNGVSARLLLVGGDEGASLSCQIEELGEKVVHVVGRVEDVRPYIQNADILCLPSLREGFPNVVLEAASLGVPAVVSDATGVVDSVINEETGRIFPVGDAESLAEALRELAVDPEKIESLGKNARAWILQDFEQHYVWSLQASNLNSQMNRS